jgi:hypothetical protein
MKLTINITEERIETAVRGAGEKIDLISFMERLKLGSSKVSL